VPNLENGQDPAESIRKIAIEQFGLNLSDSLIETLSEGKSISIEDLLQEYSLAEVGTTLIRMDMLNRSKLDKSWCKPCPPGEIGCAPICVKIPQRPPSE
jgi:hypothetical protein